MDIFFKVEYGAGSVYRDVTDIIIKKLSRRGTIFIPQNDGERAHHFGDPLPGVVKEVVITLEERGKLKRLTYPHGMIGLVDLPIASRKISYQELNHVSSPAKKLKKIHKSLLLSGGSLSEEYPQQLHIAEFISQDAKVLQLGANIGRNSLIIASLLQDDRNLVAVECNAVKANILECNKHNNQFNFYVETSAISDHNECIKSLGVVDGKTITLPDFMEKYQIYFDTLVVNCEGALFHILRSYPKLLYGINLVIVENDYPSYDQKVYVDCIFRDFGLEIIRSNPGPSSRVCESNFYEVWQRIH